MLSIEEICNEALGLIGENPIVSLDEIETKAIRCKQFWNPTRDACLRSHTWNFATRRARLELLSETPPFGYAYYYQRPENCIRLVIVTDDAADIDSLNIQDSPVEYKLEEDKILTDAETLYCKYVRRVEETGYWDSLFCAYVAAEMAAKVGAGLVKSAALVNSMIELAAVRRQVAIDVDTRESGTQAVRKRSSWLKARD